MVGDTFMSFRCLMCVDKKKYLLGNFYSRRKVCGHISFVLGFSQLHQCTTCLLSIMLALYTSFVVGSCFVGAWFFIPTISLFVGIFVAVEGLTLPNNSTIDKITLWILCFIYIYTYIYSIKPYKYFCIYPFKLRYWCNDIRKELIYKASIIGSLLRSCHHQKVYILQKRYNLCMFIITF